MCCPLGSETEVTQGHTPAATGEKSSRSTGNGSAKQPHRRWSSFEPQQTKLRAQLLLQLQRHLQAHLPLRKKLLWLLVQRFLSHHNHVEMQSLTWEETRGNYRENLTFNSGYDSQDSKLSWTWYLSGAQNLLEWEYHTTVGCQMQAGLSSEEGRWCKLLGDLRPIYRNFDRNLFR